MLAGIYFKGPLNPFGQTTVIPVYALGVVCVDPLIKAASYNYTKGVSLTYQAIHQWVKGEVGYDYPIALCE